MTGSALPAASVAVTASLCLPGLSFLTLNGEAHGFAGFLSSAQVNVAPASEEKVNFALVAVVLLAGLLPILVSGGVVSDAVTGAVMQMTENR